MEVFRSRRYSVRSGIPIIFRLRRFLLYFVSFSFLIRTYEFFERIANDCETFARRGRQKGGRYGWRRDQHAEWTSGFSVSHKISEFFWFRNFWGKNLGKISEPPAPDFTTIWQNISYRIRRRFSTSNFFVEIRGRSSTSQKFYSQEIFLRTKPIFL